MSTLPRSKDADAAPELPNDAAMVPTLRALRKNRPDERAQEVPRRLRETIRVVCGLWLDPSQPAQRECADVLAHTLTVRNLSALPITDTELADIAALAIIGLSSTPSQG